MENFEELQINYKKKLQALLKKDKHIINEAIIKRSIHDRVDR